LAGSAEAQAKPVNPPAAAAAPPAAPASAASTASTASTAAGGTTAAAKPVATAAAATTSGPTAQKPSEGSNEELSSDIPVEVDLDGELKIEPGDERKVTIRSRKDVTCELLLRLPDG